MLAIIQLALKFFPTIWRQLVVATLVIGAVWYVSHLHNVISEKDRLITELTSRNSILVTNQQTLTSALDRFNQSIDVLARGAIDTQQKFSDLNNTVSSQTTKLTAQINQIKNAPKPVDCQSTIKYLLDAIPEYAK